MEDIFANRKIIDGNIAKAEEIRLRVSEIEKQIEDELQKAKSQCDEIMNNSGNNIKEQMAAALEDSKMTTTQLINEAEGRLKELRAGSAAAIEKISEELASEIIKDFQRKVILYENINRTNIDAKIVHNNNFSLRSFAWRRLRSWLEKDD